jgi:acyl-CoA thioester hydrolase
MKPYVHKVQYYETDMMGVVHHANYLHWMEEARIDLMDQLGFPYAEMERKGVLSPVKSLSCEYRNPCSFGDEIRVSVRVDSFNGVVMTIVYDMKNGNGETVCEAKSEHVFLDREGRFVRMKREMPEFCAAAEAFMRGRG